jgi:DtxR family Mn-dependent transcriptional regulator
MADAAADLSGSMEDYLETIFHLTQDKGFARVKNISRRMKVHMPSVTGALQTLSARGLVNYEPYAVVTLTAEGEAVARRLVRTHEALRTFLSEILGLADAEADENACRMEHAISPATIERLIAFTEFVEGRPGEAVDVHAIARQFRKRRRSGAATRPAAGAET